jgi:hypothetical protein
MLGRIVDLFYEIFESILTDQDKETYGIILGQGKDKISPNEFTWILNLFMIYSSLSTNAPNVDFSKIFKNPELCKNESMV